MFRPLYKYRIQDHPLCSRWLFAAGPLAHHTAGFSLRQLLHGLSGVLSLWLLLYGLLSTDPVALPVLGWFLPASSGRANSAESPSAASFGLPAAGVAGAKLADAISAPPAGDLRRADDGVPVNAHINLNSNKHETLVIICFAGGMWYCFSTNNTRKRWQK